MNRNFKPSTSAEITFIRQLRKVGVAAGHIVGLYIDGTHIIDAVAMQAALKAYSKALDPWARNQAKKMLLTVENANKRAMKSNSKLIGQGLRLVAESAVGEASRKLMDEQVELIKSIPLKAGERAQKLSMEAVLNGERASEVAKRLIDSGKVAESDANLIARTEVARASSVLTQARATAIGSTNYVWRTSKDAAVRESHKEMEGKVERWDSPPELSDGTTGNPGTFPNCRCYPEPIFTDLF
jgi:SPP1 gp7 family putative phage head morphogenesis protein